VRIVFKRELPMNEQEFDHVHILDVLRITYEVVSVHASAGQTREIYLRKYNRVNRQRTAIIQNWTDSQVNAYAIQWAVREPILIKKVEAQVIPTLRNGWHLADNRAVISRDVLPNVD
jgi:hypothetical protein